MLEVIQTSPYNDGMVVSFAIAIFTGWVRTQRYDAPVMYDSHTIVDSTNLTNSDKTVSWSDTTFGGYHQWVRGSTTEGPAWSSDMTPLSEHDWSVTTSAGSATVPAHTEAILRQYYHNTYAHEEWVETNPSDAAARSRSWDTYEDTYWRYFPAGGSGGGGG